MQKRRQSNIQKYEVGLRRHFFGPNDGLLWHKLALDFLDGGVAHTRAQRWVAAARGDRQEHSGTDNAGGGSNGDSRPLACCGSLAEYNAEVEAARVSVAARKHAATAVASAPVFTIAVLQRKEGRRFADMPELMACLQVRGVLWRRRMRGT